MSEKISKFASVTSLQTTDFFNIVRDGQNLKLDYASFLSGLGVSGQISSIGANTSVPVLFQPASNYNYIRGIEPKQGVTAQVSAQGGIELKTNLANATGGDASLIVDPTATQIKWRQLVAGDGIELDQDGDLITLSTTTATASVKTVIVQSVDDFPTAVSGVITLADNTDYFLANDIATANRFVAGNRTSVRGPASQIVTLSYSGTGTMFTSTNPNFRIDRVTVSCPNGKLFDMSSSGGGIFQMIESNIAECDTIGDIGSMFIVRFKGVAFQDIKTEGMTFSGAIDIFFSDTFVSFMNGVGGTLYDLGSATFNSVTIDNQFDKSSVASTFISGLAASGNINADGLATCRNALTQPTTTTLSGVSPNDARWVFLANNDIQDTRPDGLVTLDAPTTTVLAAATPAKISGAFTVQRQSQMTGDATGRITFDGVRSATLPLSTALSVEPVSGTNKSVNIYFAKNGTVQTTSKVNTVVSAGTPKNQSILWQDNWANGDYYEVFIESVDGTDIQVNTMAFRVD